MSPPAIEPRNAAPSVPALPPVIASVAAPVGPAKPAVATPDEDPRPAAIGRGQQNWQTRRGPRHAALSECDLGLGAGRVVGTFAHLPRHFADADRVMDLETRLLWCARAQQEREPASLMLARAVDGVMASELEDLAAYVASLSISWRLSPPLAHARERQAQAVGQALYARRQGPLDFSCASCHGSAGQPQPAISGSGRAQTITTLQGRPVPQFGQSAQAQAAMAAWPAWRTSQGGLRTLQSRLAACFWHMGIEPPAQGSDSLIALVAYLTRLAGNGEVLASGRRP